MSKFGLEPFWWQENTILRQVRSGKTINGSRNVPGDRINEFLLAAEADGSTRIDKQKGWVLAQRLNVGSGYPHFRFRVAHKVRRRPALTPRAQRTVFTQPFWQAAI